MKIIAGIDIGNATTETAIAQLSDEGTAQFLASGLAETTGIKGTRDNLPGLFSSLKQALDRAGLDLKNLDLIRINEAAPVIGDVAMETITETIITESTMIGHNPTTPGGLGTGVGLTCLLDQVPNYPKTQDLIVVISSDYGFQQIATLLNTYHEQGYQVKGAILQRDDAVLVHNRIQQKIPIVDEVTLIENVPLSMLAAIEVAALGSVIETLSNPYGVATLFQLDGEQTKAIVPIARSLIGNRSAVVIKTPSGDIKAKSIPAGKLMFEGESFSKTVDVGVGADNIMQTVQACTPLSDVKGEAGSNAGGMLEKVRHVMANLTSQPHQSIKIQDLLAVDTLSPQHVHGAIAGEYSMESAVGIAVMVKVQKLQMARVAEAIQERLHIPVEVGGVEALMAIKGALTTPGAGAPLAILDMGAGSTDASFRLADGQTQFVHLAGAGDMVTLLIKTELGLSSTELAEDIKKYSLAKAESMFHIRHEDGSVEFFPQPIDTNLFAKVVIVKGHGEYVPIENSLSIEKIKRVRQQAKIKVFVTNAVRALEQVSTTGNIKAIEHVVLVGGSALDFEIPQFVTEALSQHGVVAGRGNIRGSEGPRNAVATGLIIIG